MFVKYMKGSYVLLIELTNETSIQIGKLGLINFPASHYVYIGSAMNGINSRVKRHCSVQKNHHWHIDYFLDKAKLEEVYVKENRFKEECDIAKTFAQKFSLISNFGSSDCHCKSHLFFGNKSEIKKIISSLGMIQFKEKTL